MVIRTLSLGPHVHSAGLRQNKASLSRLDLTNITSFFNKIRTAESDMNIDNRKRAFQGWL
jgi:hypothetical protein